jgi:hypothetical protein
MNEYPTVDALSLDPMPTAAMVEMVVGDYLRAPDAGIYFKGKIEPVMVPGRLYRQQPMMNGVKSGEAYIVATLADLNPRFPVIDEFHQVVVTPNQIPFLDFAPSLPVAGLRVVRRAVEDIIESYGSTPAGSRVNVDPVQLYTEFLSDVLLQEQQEVAEHVIDQITGIVGEIRAQVRNFCGDNRWVMHFLRELYGTFLIEKSIDWRVIEYHRLTKTKYGR